MKTLTFRNRFVAATALAGMAWFGNAAEDATPAQTPPPPPPPAEAVTAPAPTQPATITVGPGVTQDVKDLVRLKESGVGSAVMQAHVERSSTAYPLSAEEIIYLHNHGVPPEVITAFIRRGSELRSQGERDVREAQYAAQQPPPPMPAPQQAAPPETYVAPATYPAYTYTYPTYAYDYSYPYWGYGYYPYVGLSFGYPWRGYRGYYGYHGYRGGFAGHGAWSVPHGGFGGHVGGGFGGHVGGGFGGHVGGGFGGHVGGGFGGGHGGGGHR